MIEVKTRHGAVLFSDDAPEFAKHFREFSDADDAFVEAIVALIEGCGDDQFFAGRRYLLERILDGEQWAQHYVGCLEDFRLEHAESGCNSDDDLPF